MRKSGSFAIVYISVHLKRQYRFGIGVISSHVQINHEKIMWYYRRYNDHYIYDSSDLVIDDNYVRPNNSRDDSMIRGWGKIVINNLSIIDDYVYVIIGATIIMKLITILITWLITDMSFALFFSVRDEKERCTR